MTGAFNLFKVLHQSNHYLVFCLSGNLYIIYMMSHFPSPHYCSYMPKSEQLGLYSAATRHMQSGCLLVVSPLVHLEAIVCCWLMPLYAIARSGSAWILHLKKKLFCVSAGSWCDGDRNSNILPHLPSYYPNSSLKSCYPSWRRYPCSYLPKIGLLNGMPVCT